MKTYQMFMEQGRRGQIRRASSDAVVRQRIQDNQIRRRRTSIGKGAGPIDGASNNPPERALDTVPIKPEGAYRTLQRAPKYDDTRGDNALKDEIRRQDRQDVRDERARKKGHLI